MHYFAKIVEQYHLANEEQRFCLYLEHPPLRDEFLEIDRQDAARQKNSRRLRPMAKNGLIEHLLLKCC